MRVDHVCPICGEWVENDHPHEGVEWTERKIGKSTTRILIHRSCFQASIGRRVKDGEIQG